MKRVIPNVSRSDVLEWLQENHPALHAVAEIDRAWVWLAVDLRGDHNKPTRESIKEFGFRWAKEGHALPSGKTGTWGHHCTVPKPFRRKGKGNGNSRPTPKQETPEENSEQNDDDLYEEIAQMLGD